MNISEAEKITGITKQNIRFYEKQGLLNPARNSDNAYREYTPQDIRTLKIIKMLRKLQMPLDQIQQVLEERISLSDAISAHQKKLLEEKETLEAAVSICRELAQETINNLDIDAKLQEIDAKEQAGGKFADIMQDFMAVARAEESKSFRFVPDTMVLNPQEFKEALLQYAGEQNQTIVFTKEGMNPEFTLNGLEYSAVRIFSRYGALVECSLIHPETVEPDYIPQKTRKTYRRLYRLFWSVLFPFLIILILVLSRIRSSADIVPALIIGFFLACLIPVFHFFFPRA